MPNEFIKRIELPEGQMRQIMEATNVRGLSPITTTIGINFHLGYAEFGNSFSFRYKYGSSTGMELSEQELQTILSIIKLTRDLYTAMEDLFAKRKTTSAV